MASTDDNPPSSSPNLNFDSVLEEIGAFGRFQKLLYFSVCITIIFTTGLGLTVVFSAAIPKTRCLIPNCDLDPVHAKYSDAFNSSTNEFAKFAIPSGKLSQCYEYVHKSSNDTVSQIFLKKFNFFRQAALFTLKFRENFFSFHFLEPMC